MSKPEELRKCKWVQIIHRRNANYYDVCIIGFRPEGIYLADVEIESPKYEINIDNLFVCFRYNYITPGNYMNEYTFLEFFYHYFAGFISEDKFRVRKWRMEEDPDLDMGIILESMTNPIEGISEIKYADLPPNVTSIIHENGFFKCVIAKTISSYLSDKI